MTVIFQSTPSLNRWEHLPKVKAGVKSMYSVFDIHPIRIGSEVKAIREASIADHAERRGSAPSLNRNRADESIRCTAPSVSQKQHFDMPQSASNNLPMSIFSQLRERSTMSRSNLGSEMSTKLLDPAHGGTEHKV